MLGKCDCSFSKVVLIRRLYVVSRVVRSFLEVVIDF